MVMVDGCVCCIGRRAFVVSFDSDSWRICSDLANALNARKTDGIAIKQMVAFSVH